MIDQNTIPAIIDRRLRDKFVHQAVLCLQNQFNIAEGDELVGCIGYVMARNNQEALYTWVDATLDALLSQTPAELMELLYRRFTIIMSEPGMADIS